MKMKILYFWKNIYAKDKALTCFFFTFCTESHDLQKESLIPSIVTQVLMLLNLT